MKELVWPAEYVTGRLRAHGLEACTSIADQTIGPTHTREIPITEGEPDRIGASKPLVIASNGHDHGASLDAVAGGEFLDDHLRLRESQS